MLGFGSKLSKAFGLDFSYMYLHQPDRAGRTNAGANPAAPTVADNNGIVQLHGAPVRAVDVGPLLASAHRASRVVHSGEPGSRHA